MRSLLLFLCASFAAPSQTTYSLEEYVGTDFAGDGKPALLAPLLQPQGLAGDRDGSILVADAADNRVRRITPDGIIHTVTTDLQAPYGVAVGPNREVYIADLGNRRIRLVTVDGAARTFASGELQQPRNVAVDANGVVYVSDFGADKVYRITPDGAMQPLAAGELKGPAGLAVDASGAVFIADSGNNRVRKVINGQANTVLSDFGIVTSIALDRTGRLYVAGGDRIAVVSTNGDISVINTPADEVGIDANGRILTVAYKQVRSYFATVTTILAGSRSGIFAGDGGPPSEWRFHRPEGLARDAAGNLYIADSGNGRVRKISTEGELSTVTAVEQAAYFAFDMNNMLYVSDSKAGIVYKNDRSGKFQIFTRGSGAKPFRNPSGLGFDFMGDLFVADTGNNLIRKVTPDGIVSTVAGSGSSESDGFGLGLALKAPVGLAVALDGTVWFTEFGKLRKLSRDGRVLHSEGCSFGRSPRITNRTQRQHSACGRRRAPHSANRTRRSLESIGGEAFKWSNGHPPRNRWLHPGGRYAELTDPQARTQNASRADHIGFASYSSRRNRPGDTGRSRAGGLCRRRRPPSREGRPSSLRPE